MADSIKTSTRKPQAWFISLEDDKKKYEKPSQKEFLTNQLSEYAKQLCFSKSTRWARVDRRYKHLSHDELPVGLTRKQRITSLAIVLGLANANVDLSEVSCLKKAANALSASEYYLIDSKGEKVMHDNQPVIVSTRVLSKPVVKSLRKPKITPRAKSEPKGWRNYISGKTTPTKPNVPAKDIKPLTFNQNLIKVVRDNYRGFAVNKNVRSVRPVYDRTTKEAVIVVTLYKQKSMSGVPIMGLDKSVKSKTGDFLNEYYFLDQSGQKVTYKGKDIKIQTRLHKISVSALKKPRTKIGSRKPSKKHAKAWFISSKKKKSSPRLTAFKRLCQAYTSQICHSKLIHWLRPGKRFEGFTKEELNKVDEKQTKNDICIHVGLRDDKVRLTNIPCLNVDNDRIHSTAFVQEYFLIDSEKKKVTIDGEFVKVQTRSLETLRGVSKKPQSFFVSWAEKKQATPEKKQSKRETLNKVVKEYYKMLVTNRDIHYCKVGRRWGKSVETSKLSEDKQRNNIAIIMALSDQTVDLSDNKWLTLDTETKADGFVNEYFLVNDSGKRIECQGYPIKVQTRVQKVKVSALGEPQNPVRQQKKIPAPEKRSPSKATKMYGGTLI
eukprot:UN24800